MSDYKKVKGVGWGNAAISNAVWKGVRLCDILKDVGAEMVSGTNNLNVNIETGIYKIIPKWVKQ